MNTCSIRVRSVALAIGIALLAGACGTGSAEPAGGDAAAPATTGAPATTVVTSTEPPPTTAVPAATTTTVAPTTTVPPTTTPPTTIPIGELPLLEESLGEKLGEYQAVAAGVYRSEALPVTLRLDLQEFSPSVAWIRDGSFVMLSLPEHGLLTHPTLFLIPLTGLPELADAGEHDHERPTVPISGVDDFDEYFESVPGLVLLGTGEEDLPGMGMYWDFTTDADVGGGFECPYGSNCFNVVGVKDAGAFIAGENFVYRLWQLGDGDLYAWLQAPTDQWDAALDLGRELLAGISIEQ